MFSRPPFFARTRNFWRVRAKCYRCPWPGLTGWNPGSLARCGALCEDTPRSPMPRSRQVKATMPTKAPAHVTLKDLAESLNLSSATVSMVINSAPAARSIPAKTQERVWAAAQKLQLQTEFHGEVAAAEAQLHDRRDRSGNQRRLRSAGAFRRGRFSAAGGIFLLRGEPPASAKLDRRVS